MGARKDYNKLVRDKIPEIIESKGHTYKTRKLTDDIEYEQALWDKLDEECKEFFDNPVPEEACDILEVLHSIMALKKTLNLTDLGMKSFVKKVEKGGFNDRIFLEYVEEK